MGEQRLMAARVPALRHNALVYDGDDEYVGRAVPFLREGLEAGQGAVVAATRPRLAVMREALGADVGSVTFVDVSSSYTRPARTLAAYHAVYADELSRHSFVRAVADVQFGDDPREWDMWTGYEAVFNRSFAHLPAWVLCSYSGQQLPDPVREGVWRTHPEVVERGGWNASDRFSDPAQLLRDAGPAPAALSGLRPIAVDADLETFRERLAREMTAERVPDSRVLDLLLAATEVATNAMTHGGGIAVARVGRADGRFVCEIVDRGPGFDDPTAGYLAPRPGVGSGLWIARRLTWQVDCFRGPDGFTVRLRL
jgi:anti-sigma regulatory factor (Ser/Thr protein kinase)